MATTSDLTLYRYSPENMPEDVLRKLFVGREKQLKSLVKEIENAAKKKTPRFYLIVGPRGIGKSHFSVLLYHEIKNKLGSLLIPIKLREEEYSVYRASDLFLRILEEKNEETEDILSLTSEEEILHAAVEKLKQTSRKDGKRYIIFIENLHELFKQLDTKELQKLRSIFQKYDIFSVIATAPMIFPGVSDHDEPFYNFFQIQYLDEFSIVEIKELIRKIAEAENNQKFIDEFRKYEPKIHGLAHLTGGSPRLVILFYEMITRRELENIEKAFFKIIDEHTPYYQEIFQLLTGQKRKIFDVVILSREPITPKQISREARIELPTVTTQLKRLEQDGYVISRPMGRYTKYEVRERLFRLWREMRQPLGRKRVYILLEFLQYWYTPEERKELFKAKFEMLEAGKKTVLRDLCYYVEVLPPKFKTEALLKLTPKLLDHGDLEEAAYEIQKLKDTASRTRSKELERKISVYEGRLLFFEKKYEDALKAFNKALEINPKDEFALFSKGYTLGLLGRNMEALETFNKALEINPKNELALINKGIALGGIGKHKEALEAFNKALEVNPKNELALANKGAALGGLGRHEEAIDVLNIALEINPKSEFVLSTKGLALEEIDRYEEAIDVLNMALEINPKNELALTNKGIALGEISKHKEALEAFNKALEVNPKNELALANKGVALGELGRHEEALEALNMALKINPKDEFILLNRVFALELLSKYEEALNTLDRALEINPQDTRSLLEKGHILGCLQAKHESALSIFDNILKINPKDVDALSHKGVTLANLNRLEEALEAFNKTLQIDPNDETALRNRSLVLLELKRYTEAADAAKKTKDSATSEISKIDAALILTQAYIFLDRKTDAILEIEKIKDRITEQKPRLIEDFTEVCFILALNELKAGNRGSCVKFIDLAYNAGTKLNEDKVKFLTMNFLKDAAESGLPIIKAAVDEIEKLQMDKYQNLVRPIIKAIEIVETKVIKGYYDLQIEEREIVADIVRKITKSDELIPPEIKTKESHLTDYAATT